MNQERILHFLSSAPQTWRRLSDIAEALGLTRRQARYAVRQLETMGHIERRGKRGAETLVRLRGTDSTTAIGNDKLDAIMTRLDALDARVETMYNLLLHLAAALEIESTSHRCMTNGKLPTFVNSLTNVAASLRSRNGTNEVSNHGAGTTNNDTSDLEPFDILSIFDQPLTNFDTYADGAADVQEVDLSNCVISLTNVDTREVEAPDALSIIGPPMTTFDTTAGSATSDSVSNAVQGLTRYDKPNPDTAGADEEVQPVLSNSVTSLTNNDTPDAVTADEESALLSNLGQSLTNNDKNPSYSSAEISHSLYINTHTLNTDRDHSHSLSCVCVHRNGILKSNGLSDESQDNMITPRARDARADSAELTVPPDLYDLVHLTELQRRVLNAFQDATGLTVYHSPNRVRWLCDMVRGAGRTEAEGAERVLALIAEIRNEIQTGALLPYAALAELSNRLRRRTNAPPPRRNGAGRSVPPGAESVLDENGKYIPRTPGNTNYVAEYDPITGELLYAVEIL